MSDSFIVEHNVETGEETSRLMTEEDMEFLSSTFVGFESVVLPGEEPTDIMQESGALPQIEVELNPLPGNSEI